MTPSLPWCLWCPASGSLGGLESWSNRYAVDNIRKARSQFSSILLPLDLTLDIPGTMLQLDLGAAPTSRWLLCGCLFYKALLRNFLNLGVKEYVGGDSSQFQVRFIPNWQDCTIFYSHFAYIAHLSYANWQSHNFSFSDDVLRDVARHFIYAQCQGWRG